jgi:site-specific recombinase XerD
MFISRHGTRITVRRVQQVWQEIQAVAGVERPCNFHGLRHFYGTSVYSKTKDIRVTQVLLRHQAVSSTQIYAHVSEREVERAVVDLF